MIKASAKVKINGVPHVVSVVAADGSHFVALDSSKRSVIVRSRASSGGLAGQWNVGNSPATVEVSGDAFVAECERLILLNGGRFE